MSLIAGAMSALGGLASSLFSGAASGAGSALGSKMVGGSDAPESLGLQSAQQGSNAPPPDTPASTTAFGAQAKELIADTAKDMLSSGKSALSGGLASAINNKLSGGAGKQGRNAREYLNNAFPELNPWELAGAGASGIGGQQAEQQNAFKMKQMELNNAKDIAKIQSSTAIKTAQISAAPSHESNVQNAPKIEAEIASIYANGSLTREQAAHEVYKTYLTQLQAAGVEVNTQKLKAEINHIVARTFNERYASSTPGKIMKDIGLLLHDNVEGQAPVPSHAGQGIPDPMKKPNYKGKR